MTAATTRPPLSRRIKFIYGLGDWGTSAATTARNLFWFVFLTNVVGLNPALAGTVVLIGRIWDSINDPLVGMLSDRVRTRWGRRRPFLLFGAVPFGFTFFLMFLVPPIESSLGLVVYYSLVYLVFDTLYTIVNVPYTALTPEQPDGFTVDGPTRLGGAEVDSHGDHRLGMALAVAGLVAHSPTRIHDAGCIADSFPGFVETMQQLGANMAWAAD